MEDTPLGQTVLIRKENDKERLKHFTKHEHKIRNDWRKFRASKIREKQNPVDTQKAIENLEKMFAQMFA